MKLTVVIPALDEREQVAAAVASAWAAGADEVLVVDGGSTDGTADAVAAPARVLAAPRGRASQLDAGWRAATGDVIVFLHADSRLPREAGDAVREAVRSGACGGAFHKRFDSSHPLLRRVRWRTRLWWALGLSFGDQAQFARRDALQACGGFRRDVVAEDMALARALRRVGRVRLLPPEVTTSARRLESRGILRTWLAWWSIALRQLARDARAPAAVSTAPRARRGSSETR